MDKFEYEGRVMLGCQEGGFASPVIVLKDLESEGGRIADINSVVRALFDNSGITLASLDEFLLRLFKDGDPNEMGDIELGNLKITVGRI